MKNLCPVIAMVCVILITVINASGQTCSGNFGIVYTSCFPWQFGDGVITVNFNGNNTNKNNDAPRIQRAINSNPGKIIFNEPEYYIDAAINLKSFRIIEGTGKSPYIANTIGTPPEIPHNSSKIIQTKPNTPIFKIGSNIYDVSVRDLALVAFVGVLPTEAVGGVTGILATNQGSANNDASLGFQFSNLRFSNLYKGIHVDATTNGSTIGVGEWQFDHVRLDQSRFDYCETAVHINSSNSGWNISSLDFLVPRETTIPEKKTYGIRLERSAYISMDTLIGNGESSNNPTLFATALIYVQEHKGNLNILNSTAEGFQIDVNIDDITRNSPITLTNNTFLNGVTVNNATVISTGNQYSALNSNGSPAIAKGGAQIYSFGDKFCTEGFVPPPPQIPCQEDRGYTLQDDARVIFSSTQNRNTTQVPSLMQNYLEIRRDSYSPNTIPSLSIIAPNYSWAPLFRLGRGNYYYDITRNELSGDGNLEFTGSQEGFGGYTFKTTKVGGGTAGTAKINHDGSVTFGSVTFSALGMAVNSSANGTMVYCADCQQTNPCSSGGAGAIAKRIAGNWICN